MTDQRGNTVTLDKPAKTIASAVIPAPAIIAAVDGSWDRIVGINDSTLKANQQGIIGKIYPGSTSTPVIADRSFIPNMETVLKVAPEVVIQWGDRGAEVTDPLAAAGIPVIGLKYGTQEDLETWIKLFGDIIGKPDRAEQILNWMHTENAAVRERVKALGKPAPTVARISYTPEKLSAATASNYEQFTFDTVGAVNVAKDAPGEGGVIGPEQLIAWNPDFIFLSAFDKTTPADFYADPRFADLTAVKNRQVYMTPLGVYRWQVPCAESPLMWNWTAAVIYGADYPISMRKTMKDREAFLYNYDMTDADVDLVLRTDINNDSTGYRELAAR